MTMRESAGPGDLSGMAGDAVMHMSHVLMEGGGGGEESEKAIEGRHVRAAAQAGAVVMTGLAEMVVERGLEGDGETSHILNKLEVLDPNFHRLSLVRAVRTRLEASLGAGVEALVGESVRQGDPQSAGGAVERAVETLLASRTGEAVVGSLVESVRDAVERARVQLAGEQDALAGAPLSGSRAAVAPLESLPRRAYGQTGSDAESSDMTSARSMASYLEFDTLVPYEDLVPVAHVLSVPIPDLELASDAHLASLSTLEGFAPGDLVAAPCWSLLVDAFAVCIASPDLGFAHRSLGLVVSLWADCHGPQRGDLFRSLADVAGRILRSQRDPLHLSDLDAFLKDPSHPLVPRMTFLMALLRVLLAFVRDLGSDPGRGPTGPAKVKALVASWLGLLSASGPELSGMACISLLDPGASWVHAWLFARSIRTGGFADPLAPALQTWASVLSQILHHRLGDDDNDEQGGLMEKSSMCHAVATCVYLQVGRCEVLLSLVLDRERAMGEQEELAAVVVNWCTRRVATRAPGGERFSPTNEEGRIARALLKELVERGRPGAVLVEACVAELVSVFEGGEDVWPLLDTCIERGLVGRRDVARIWDRLSPLGTVPSPVFLSAHQDVSARDLAGLIENGHLDLVLESAGRSFPVLDVLREVRGPVTEKHVNDLGLYLTSRVLDELAVSGKGLRSGDRLPDCGFDSSSFGSTAGGGLFSCQIWHALTPWLLDPSLRSVLRASGLASRVSDMVAELVADWGWVFDVQVILHAPPPKHTFTWVLGNCYAALLVGGEEGLEEQEEALVAWLTSAVPLEVDDVGEGTACVEAYWMEVAAKQRASEEWNWVWGGEWRTFDMASDVASSDVASSDVTRRRIESRLGWGRVGSLVWHAATSLS